MDKYLYWLDNVLYLGCPAKCRLLKVFGSAEEIYRADEKLIGTAVDEKKMQLLLNHRRVWEVDREYEKLWEKNISMITLVEEGFPEKLKTIPDPPFCLYYIGMLPEETLPSVAIIGARECSDYGVYVAEALGKCLGEQHIQVISGMARGIDGISQRAALEAGGTSYGILGCGADICYPKGNRRIYDRLCSSGGVISTYPPGTSPQPQLFPPRNRIVSGLADVLVVIEARQKSGTYTTVEMALEQGREIYAVPGRVTDRLSDGCNKMLRDGAHVFLSPQDFVQELYQMLPVKMETVRRYREQCLLGTQDFVQNSAEIPAVVSYRAESIEGKILSVLDFYPQYVEVIGEKLSKKYGLQLSIQELSTNLMQMSLMDQIRQETPGFYSKIR